MHGEKLYLGLVKKGKKRISTGKFIATFLDGIDYNIIKKTEIWNHFSEENIILHLGISNL